MSDPTIAGVENTSNPARKGLFIVFEGGDSVGKSTQVSKLVEALEALGIDHVVTFEPGDTWLGGQIRRLVLDPDSGDISPRAEVLLFGADKAQHVKQVILPAIAQGAVVVSDRYVDSMLAYQGAGRALADEDLAWVGHWATGGLLPDLTILLDADPEVALRKIERKDRLEGAGLQFHRRVRQYFLDLAAQDPQRYFIVKALTDKEGIAVGIREKLAGMGLPELSDFRGMVATMEEIEQ